MNKISLKPAVLALVLLSAMILGAVVAVLVVSNASPDKTFLNNTASDNPARSNSASLKHLPGQDPSEEINQAPPASDSAGTSEREILYWYDPMYPAQHFDQPGKSPFMDMDLIPKYASATGAQPGIHIEPAITQALGMRTAQVRYISDRQQLSLSGRLAFNDRLLHVLQLRSAGFVERVWPLAVGDRVRQGAPLVEFLMPEWSSAQYEFLAVADVPELREAARRRLVLLGMPEAMIQRVEKSRDVEPRWTLRAPIDGIIDQWDVRAGMAMSAGDTLARIIGTETLWLEAAIPEAQAENLSEQTTLTFYAARAAAPPVEGKIESLLPKLDETTRTVTARAVVPNPEGALRAGTTGRVVLQTGSERQALAVPTEAVIHTGSRALVMLKEDDGRFSPAEISIGRELGDMTTVTAGLREGQTVVASGQFLLDSEASLLGIAAASTGSDSPMGDTHDHHAESHEPELDRSVLHEAEGEILAISPEKVRLKHGPFPSLSMPGMTMSFKLADPALAGALQVGDRVRVAVKETDEGLLVEVLEQLPREVQP